MYELIADIVLMLRGKSLVLHDDFTTYQVNLIFQIQSDIMKNLNNGIRIESITEEFGISSSKLQKLFKSVLHTSPHNYIQDEKLKKAKDDLTYDDKPIAQLSDELGFSSPSHFSASFKKKFGITPQKVQRSTVLTQKLL